MPLYWLKLTSITTGLSFLLLSASVCFLPEKTLDYLCNGCLYTKNTPTVTTSPTSTAAAITPLTATATMTGTPTSTTTPLPTTTPSASLSLHVNPPGNLTLNGTEQMVNYSLTLTIVNQDSLQGWYLTITSTPFTSENSHQPATFSAHFSQSLVSSITYVSARCQSGASCTVPVNLKASSYPIAIPIGNPEPTAVKFFCAQSHTGIGSFVITAQIAIKIPMHAHAGSYKSTIVVAFVNHL